MRAYLIVWQLLLVCVSALRFGAIPGQVHMLNYTEGDEWCGASFECNIMSFLCQQIAIEEPCTLEILDSRIERVRALEEDRVDIVVGRFEVTPSNSRRVQFVRPYYYSSGASLFVLPEAQDFISSYDELDYSTVCMDIGFYASKTLAEDIGFTTFPSITNIVLDLINSGYCNATFDDSLQLIKGLVRAQITPTSTRSLTPTTNQALSPKALYEIPMGVAVAKDPSFDNLENLVHVALLKLFVKEDWIQSEIEKWESDFLVVEGFEKSNKLLALSDAITANFDDYIGEEMENAIWQAANLSAVESYGSDLDEIIPEYNESCWRALDNMYDSYQNGTKLSELPQLITDEVSYTYIANITKVNNLQFAKSFIRHPFFEHGTAVHEIAVTNPQMSAVAKLIQDAIVEDELGQDDVNATLDYQFFYKTIPFDAAPVFANDSAWDEFLLPTKVMTTQLFLTFEGIGNEEDDLFLGACGVGELREWN
eukprot:TRINITY_DN5097_c0_g1_i5.p1 TRINITY_DN5097_c0_g1~~TRINITY_DN5097_c0_g1_i5.p1  ORF type:complete len:480 (+),score=66.41 TRINITY_DN5097_c0_g1_i5:41-1480(+)